MRIELVWAGGDEGLVCVVGMGKRKGRDELIHHKKGFPEITMLNKGDHVKIKQTAVFRIPHSPSNIF